MGDQNEHIELDIEKWKIQEERDPGVTIQDKQVKSRVNGMFGDM